MLGLSLTDPAVLERFRNAAVDLLTHPVFTAPARSALMTAGALRAG